MNTYREGSEARVRVCVRESERERGRGRRRESERERGGKERCFRLFRDLAYFLLFFDVWKTERSNQWGKWGREEKIHL